MQININIVFFFLIFDAMSLMSRIESELSEDIIHLNCTVN